MNFKKYFDKIWSGPRLAAFRQRVGHPHNKYFNNVFDDTNNSYYNIEKSHRAKVK